MTSEIVTTDSSFLSFGQLAVVDAFEEGKNLFVTGGAGSGKSYLLNFLKRKYGHLGLEVTASTGIASVNIGGSTIHSWAGIGLANLPIEQIIENLFTAKFARVRRKIKRAKALAIDEISMISCELLEVLNKVFQAVRENEQPMGGIQILLFGDFLQLPPVNRGSNYFNFCFNSQTWHDLDLQAFVLDGSFRQSGDDDFVKVLNNLRIGNLEKSDRVILESRIGANDNGVIRPTILTTHNLKVEEINSLELKKIPREEVVHVAEYFGEPTRIEFLKKNCLAAEILSLKVGAQVMMIKNTYQKEGIINGSLGIIREFSSRKNYPVVEFANGKILTIAPEEWLIEKFDSEKKIVVTEAGVSQVPLILAWAMTIHKSQGLTLDKISCDLSDAFSPGQVYVALSRARSLDGVFIKSINFEKIFADSAAVKFYKNL
ncbi:MAG: AAA family ATPase [Proteobacteria bacterium]|nr:AAA family ATPase [Pseudomonadota bacterium]